MAKGEPVYKVDCLGVVDQQIEALTAQAAAAGVSREYTQSLRTVIDRLRTRPLDWGDPEWSTRKEGGTVCHGIMAPLIVRYVVFEPERYVCILKITPMAPSRLD
ncbi:MAG TPA: hypothetical protein VKA46_21645 [Gemmataceae bacterium]|nr:hypothetical protein [Gemmataceae bacterium]